MLKKKMTIQKVPKEYQLKTPENSAGTKMNENDGA